MNGLFGALGIEAWKPIVGALLLPPLPLLALAVAGAVVLPRRRGAGWALLGVALALLWLSHSVAFGEWLVRATVGQPVALDVAAEIRAQHDPDPRRATAVVVLGGGRERLAPEYRMANLSPTSMERLRYGVWLGQQTGSPVLYSGGSGHAQPDGPTEAEAAARIAEFEWHRPLRWVEDRSRDTRENAFYSVALLRQQGIRRIVLVSHDWHLARARRAFEAAAREAGVPLEVVAAPVGLAPRIERPLLRWLPSIEGYTLVRRTLHEAIGLVSGA